MERKVQNFIKTKLPDKNVEIYKIDYNKIYQKNDIKEVIDEFFFEYTINDFESFFINDDYDNDYDDYDDYDLYSPNFISLDTIWKIGIIFKQDKNFIIDVILYCVDIKFNRQIKAKYVISIHNENDYENTKEKCINNEAIFVKDKLYIFKNFSLLASKNENNSEEYFIYKNNKFIISIYCFLYNNEDEDCNNLVETLDKCEGYEAENVNDF
eukprot:jgi/Orpsp1_1/1185588/evm.model.c7180000094496.1